MTLFADVIRVKMRSYSIKAGPNTVTDVLIRRENRGRHTKGEFHVKMETEIGAMCLQAK